MSRAEALPKSSFTMTAATPFGSWLLNSFTPCFILFHTGCRFVRRASKLTFMKHMPFMLCVEVLARLTSLYVNMYLSSGRATCASISSLVAPGMTATMTPMRVVKGGNSSFGIMTRP